MGDFSWDDKLKKYRELIKNISQSTTRTISSERSIVRAPAATRSLSVVTNRPRKSRATESVATKLHPPQLSFEVTGFGLLQRNKNRRSAATSNSSFSSIPTLQPLGRSSIASGRRREMELSIQSVNPSLQLSPLLLDDGDEPEHSIHITPPPTSNGVRQDAATSTERNQRFLQEDPTDRVIESIRTERKRITDQLLNAILN